MKLFKARLEDLPSRRAATISLVAFAALGQQIVVDNRVGAIGSIGAAAAPPDGYTLLMGAVTSHSISAALNPKVATFSMEKSFAPVAMVGTVPLVFVVNPSLSQQDTRDSMLAQGVIANYTTPEEAVVALRNESARWTRVIRDGNIQAE